MHILHYFIFIFLPCIITCIKYIDGEISNYLVIAGNFTINGRQASIAHFDPSTNVWSSSRDPKLMQSIEDSSFKNGSALLNGVIWDIAINRSSVIIYRKPVKSKSSSSSKHNLRKSTQAVYADKMMVVGDFDQMLLKGSEADPVIHYCGIGEWDNVAFSKVGGGLCQKGDYDYPNELRTATLGGSTFDQLFVGGSFWYRVWGGISVGLLDIMHIGMYDVKDSTWSPLSNGPLDCVNCVTRVSALHWVGGSDQGEGTLYIGGEFDLLGYTENSKEYAGLGIAERNKKSLHSLSLAVWTPSGGLAALPHGSGGVALDMAGSPGSVRKIAYHSKSRLLIVAGVFHYVAEKYCPFTAAWNSANGQWVCLYSKSHAISTPTALTMNGNLIYIAGWASHSSSWIGLSSDKRRNYTIAVTDISTLVALCSEQNLGYAANLSSSSSKHQLISNNSFHYKETALPGVLVFDGVWSYLPHFAGLNGPIFHLMSPVKIKRQLLSASTPNSNGNKNVDHGVLKEGETTNEKLESVIANAGLYIVGAFNDEPSVLYYQSGAVVSVGASSDQIQGLVTYIDLVELWRPIRPFRKHKSNLDDIDPKPSVDTELHWYSNILFNTVLLILAFGGLLSICMCVTGNFHNFPYSFRGHKSGSSDGSFHGHGGFIPLGALGGTKDSRMDLEACFQRAMKARHMPSHSSLCFINTDEILLEGIIGQGSFGRVWSGRYLNNDVAVKEFVFAQAAVSGESMAKHQIIEEIVGEAGIMTHLRHPKILQLYGCCMTAQAIWLVSELCNRGSLRMLLSNSNVELNTHQKLSLCLDVAGALQYLHTRTPPVIHRDIKSHNIFVHEYETGKFTAKLGDWGSARAIGLAGMKTMTQGVGTACWLAPEIIHRASYSKDSDVFAFGIVLWEVDTRAEVYEGLSAEQIIARVANDELRPRVPESCVYGNLMRKCWREDPASRPDFYRICVALQRMLLKIENPRISDDECPSFQHPLDPVSLSYAPSPSPQHAVSFIPFSSNRMGDSVQQRVDSLMKGGGESTDEEETQNEDSPLLPTAGTDAAKSRHRSARTGKGKTKTKIDPDAGGYDTT